MRLAAGLVIAASLASCHGRAFRERHTVGREMVARDFGRKVHVHGTALLPGPEAGMLAIWSDDSGVWSLPMSAAGIALRDPSRVSRLGAALVAAVDLGADCAGAAYAVVAAPRVTATEGNAPLEVMLLAPDGGRTRTILMAGVVGPYTAGVTAAGDCDGVLVGWHQGSVGGFSAHVALVNPREGTVEWERKLSDGSTSGFCPGLVAAGGMRAAAWGEIDPGFLDAKKDEPVPDRIMFATLGADGSFEAGPRRILESRDAEFTPALVRHAGGLAVLYKDHSVDESRSGIYIALVDREGGSKGTPQRIGRGDGPDRPVLLGLPEDRLSTAVVRSLAYELLVGVNFLDRRGGKLSGELQLYSHKVKFRHLSAYYRKGEILLLAVEQAPLKTRLLLTSLVTSFGSGRTLRGTGSS